mgnify:FL=1
MNGPIFTNINQHWAHFLERDIPSDAPDVQVSEMKRAFAAGAISGLQLAISKITRDQIMQHVKDIKALALAKEQK